MNLKAPRISFLRLVSCSGAFAALLICGVFSAPAPDENEPLPPDPVLEPAFFAFQEWYQEISRAGIREMNAAARDHGLELARQRRMEMADLIQSDPQRALELRLPPETRRQLAPVLADQLEETIEGIGNLWVLSVCGTPAETRLVRSVEVNGASFTAHPFGGLLEAPCLKNIPISGIALDGHLALNDLPEELIDGNRLSAAATRYTTGVKRALFIRVDFSDLPGDPFSDSTGERLVDDLDAFYRHQSYDKTGFFPVGAGTEVTPTYRMPGTAAYYGGNNLASELRQAARQAAADDGYVLSNYDFDLTCMANVPRFNWAGLGYVGAPGTWIRGSLSLFVVGHELGHNFGLGHAKFHDTKGFNTIGPGDDEEYGDKFDVMGSGGGDKGFNAFYRNLLGWLPDADVFHVTQSGLYEINAYDPDLSSGKRMIHIEKDASTDYYLEFRQDQTSYPAIKNGAILRWTRDSSNSSVLLDTNPSSDQGKNDSALPLGKTFSDTEADIHITPISIRNNTQASIQLDIQFDPPADNQPPSAAVQAAPADGSLLQRLQLNVESDDPDGDSLSCHWDFGDGAFSASAPTALHEWVGTKTYPVRALVTDRKGGLAVSGFDFQVQPNSSPIVSGRITDSEGEPIPSVRVFAPNLGDTYTDADGMYSLPGLNATEVTLYAEKSGYSFLHPAFSNPVPNTTLVKGIDWIGVQESELQSETVLERGGIWRYWDIEGQPTGAWKSLSFDDSFWEEGQAELGYGDNREMTVISYGSDPDNKNITAYFRAKFEIDNIELVNRMRLELVRDDGAVVYLNGQEILRDNMPEGVIEYDTTAEDTVGGSSESRAFPFTLPPTALRNGTNQLAVEVHQVNRNSSDLSFDLGLSVDRLPYSPQGTFISSPASGAIFTAPTNIIVSVIASGGSSGDVEYVDLRANDLSVGQDSSEPYRFNWANVQFGSYALQAVAVTTDGTEIPSPPVQIAVVQNLVSGGSVWKYLDNGRLPGTNWTEPDFDDQDWSSGPAPLGYGGNGEVTTVSYGPNSSSKYITTYFRRAFSVSNPDFFHTLRVGLRCDDGAVAYLNGAEILRYNLPEGTVTSRTLAIDAVGGDDETSVFAFSVTGHALREGVNVLAVEVHQASQTSSDIIFDLEMSGSARRMESSPMLTLESLGDILVLDWQAGPGSWTPETAARLNGNAPWVPATGPSLLRPNQSTLFFSPDAPIGFFRLR